MTSKLLGLAVTLGLPTMLAAQTPQIPNEHASDRGKAMSRCIPKEPRTARRTVAATWWRSHTRATPTQRRPPFGPRLPFPGMGSSPPSPPSAPRRRCLRTRAVSREVTDPSGRKLTRFS